MNTYNGILYLSYEPLQSMENNRSLSLMMSHLKKSTKYIGGAIFFWVRWSVIWSDRQTHCGLDKTIRSRRIRQCIYHDLSRCSSQTYRLAQDLPVFYPCQRCHFFCSSLFPMLPARQGLHHQPDRRIGQKSQICSTVYNLPLTYITTGNRPTPEARIDSIVLEYHTKNQ